MSRKALRYNQGKLPYELLPAYPVEVLVKVYQYGTNKYAPRNWEKGNEYSINYGALMRHLQKWWQGEDLDPESGLPHLAHVAWGTFALLEYERRGVGTDDRNKYPA